MPEIEPLQNIRGAPPEYQRLAAEICFDAFRDKFQPIFRSREKGIVFWKMTPYSKTVCALFLIRTWSVWLGSGMPDFF